MPSLSRGQENTSSILNWFITVSGILTDAFEVGYQIFDITNGIPGTQTFPATPGAWEDVSDAPGNFSPGSYYAYDNAAAKGWTPSIAATIGTHRINWRWKISETAPYQQDAEDFEILIQSAGNTTDTYITVQDVRNAGLTDTTAYPDSTILASIELWQALLDRACRQWFLPKTITFSIDGNNSDTLNLGVPIISIEYLKINNDSVALDPSYYAVHNAISYPDDRRNPRITLHRSCEYRDIFTAPMTNGDLKFRKGRKNQLIKGVFGFVEENMAPPSLIKRALLKLVIEKVTKPPLEVPGSNGVQPPPIIGALLEEMTDFHSVVYAPAGAKVAVRSPYMIGITNDQEVIEIIKLYKAPTGIAVPSSSSY